MTRKWLFLLFVLFSFPIYGNTQIFKSMNFQLRSGAELPLKADHFEKYWAPGFHLGGSLEFYLNEMIALKFDAGFNSFIFDHQTWKADLLEFIPELNDESDDIVVNGAGRYIIEAAIAAKFFPLKTNQPISPFFLAGAGLIQMRTDELIVGFGGPEFTTESVPYYCAGVGTEISYWENFRFFGQFVYKVGQTKDENNFDFAIDLSKPYKKQETHFMGLEFGIIFDLVK